MSTTPNAREIAERIINFDKVMYESNMDVGLKHNPPDYVNLARAYLELEKENYRVRCEKQSDVNTIEQLHHEARVTDQYVFNLKEELERLKK